MNPLLHIKKSVMVSVLEVIFWQQNVVQVSANALQKEFILKVQFMIQLNECLYLGILIINKKSQKSESLQRAKTFANAK